MSFVDDITLGVLDPERSRKEQVKNGFRLGAGVGGLLIGMMLLVSGLRRMVSSVPPHHLVWSEWIAWIEICTGLVLLSITAQVWLIIVCGGAMFAFAYEVLVLIFGKDLGAPHRPIPRVETLPTAFFWLATFLPLLRFFDTRPSVLDRVALTFYSLVIAIWMLGHRPASTLIDPWPMAGLIALAMAWCAHRWKMTKAGTPEAQLSR